MDKGLDGSAEAATPTRSASRMRFLSVCSGIEAASCAWNPIGWEAAAFSEIEQFPCAILAHHYPTVPNWGDMTKFKEWPDAAFDLLCGGTPCQSFSVAGLRKGLDDPRGNLMLTFGAIADRYRPRWLVWENVAGVLSSNKGRDFGAFIGLLGILGYGIDKPSSGSGLDPIIRRISAGPMVDPVNLFRNSAARQFPPERVREGS